MNHITPQPYGPYFIGEVDAERSILISHAERNWIDGARLIEPYDLRGFTIYDTAFCEFKLDAPSCFDDQGEVVEYQYKDNEPIAIFSRQISQAELTEAIQSWLLQIKNYKKFGINQDNVRSMDFPQLIDFIDRQQIYGYQQLAEER